MIYHLKLIEVYHDSLYARVSISNSYNLPDYFKATLYIDNIPHQNVAFRLLQDNTYWFEHSSVKKIASHTILHIEPSEFSIEKYKIIIDLSDRNGFIREQTLHTADLHKFINDTEVLEVLLFRLNDWVTPVRDIAREVTIKWLHACNPQFILENLYKIKKTTTSNKARSY